MITDHPPSSLPPIPRPEDRRSGARYQMATVLGVASVGLYLFILAFTTMRSEYTIWAGYAFAPVLFFVTVPLLLRTLRKVEPDEWIHKVVVTALGVKLIASFVRFYVNEYVLGQGDAHNYYNEATDIAREFRQFVFGGPAFQELIPKLSGTSFIRLLTSGMYFITGATELGGYVLYSFLSFWGLYLWYRAYRIAMPDGLHRRYALLVFFLPSMVFWPSSIGKEAWMITMLGLGSYGLAKLLTQQRGAYLALVAAVAGMGVVRPHVAAIFFAGVGAAFVLRRTKGTGGTGRKIFGLLVLAAVAGVLLNQLQSFFDFTDSSFSVSTVLDETSRRSSQGGAQFTTARATSPAGFPWAFITVLFRPFLVEATSPASLITAIEGTILLGLFLWNMPRLVRLPKMMIARPYVGFAVIYTLIFAFAFSAIGNFGILTRQRTQLFPIAVIVLTAPYNAGLRTRSERMAAGGENRFDLDQIEEPFRESESLSESDSASEPIVTASSLPVSR